MLVGTELDLGIFDVAFVLLDEACGVSKSACRTRFDLPENKVNKDK